MPADDEIIALLDELKGMIQSYGGLPKPDEHPEFYAKLQAFIDIVKEVGIKFTLRDIAEHLGVPYGQLKARLAKYRKLEDSGKLPEVPREQVEEPARPSEPVDIQLSGASQELEESAAPMKEKESKEEEVVEEKPVTLRTEARIAEAVKRHLAKKAETLSKEEVEKLIAIGKRVRERYEKMCYMYGYDDVIKCLDDAFDSLFNVVPMMEELKEKYDVAVLIIRELAKANDSYLRLKLILGEFYESIGSDEALELMEELLEVQ